MRIADEHVFGAVQQRVAVGRSLRHQIGREIAAGAGLVLDHDGLAETNRQPLTVKPRDDVDRAARRIADDQPDRPVGVGLRLCERRTKRGRNQQGHGDAAPNDAVKRDHRILPPAGSAAYSIRKPSDLMTLPSLS